MTNPLSEDFGTVPQDSETFGSIPQNSEEFRNVPNDAEPFRTVRNISERTENHTLTVREVARLFEQAGVPRTERSIINWCRLNRYGVARLDAFFDENERRYLITPQSVNSAIEEELARQRSGERAAEVPLRKPSEGRGQPAGESVAGANSDDPILRHRLLDLEITNKAKDYFIEKLQQEQERFDAERRGYVEKLINFSQKVGRLETQLLQLGGAEEGDNRLPQGSEDSGSISNVA